MSKANANEVAYELAVLARKHNWNLSDINRGMTVLSNLEHDRIWKMKERVVMPVKEGASCSIDAHKTAVLNLETECLS